MMAVTIKIGTFAQEPTEIKRMKTNVKRKDRKIFNTQDFK